MKNKLLKIVSFIFLSAAMAGLSVCSLYASEIPGAEVEAETAAEAAVTAESEATGEAGAAVEAGAAADAGVEATGEAGAAVEAGAAEQFAEGNRIYFAAPLFSEAEREYNLKIVHILESYGYEVFLPQRDGFLAPELEGKTEAEKIEMIFQKDEEEVLKADILFMLLDGMSPDEGACVELGIAYANGKRCYGFKSDSRATELNLDLNPMISGCLDKLFYNLDGEELINSLEEYLKNNQL